MAKFWQNQWVKKIGQGLLVVVIGLILFNVTFGIYAVYHNGLYWLAGFFASDQVVHEQWLWLGPVIGSSFLLLVALLSWLIFRTKWRPLLKAIYLTQPVAIVLVMEGMFLSSWPVLVYSIGFILCAATLYIFQRTKQPWLYYLAVIFVGLTLAIFTLSGGEI